MHSQTILEIIDAAHLSKHIESPFHQRGGIMMQGPPATLKTTFIQNVLDEHYDALVVSDINIQTLMKLRSDFRTGRYSTLAFTEFSKVYARRGDTASNLEAAIHQLVEEGFTKPSFVDQRMSMTRSRCFVIGAMTETFYESKYNEWMDSGFMRRFLWCNLSIANAHLLMDSVARWKPLDLGEYKTRKPGNKFIPLNNNDKENDEMRVMLREQVGTTTPFVLLKKILAVLHWKYDKEDSKKAMKIMRDFAPCLLREGDEITLEERQLSD
jgi:hypothetical protein